MGETWQAIDWFYLGGGLGFCLGLLLCAGIQALMRLMPLDADKPSEPKEREDWR